MRLNRFVAQSAGESRRGADELIASGRIAVNGRLAELGQQVEMGDTVTLDGRQLDPTKTVTVMFNKPVGYVTSRRQQDSTPTIYKLLPQQLMALKPVGRLDKDSSGLLLLTNDGALAQALTHPSQGKWKTYMVSLDRTLTANDREKLRSGVVLDDGLSRLLISGQGPPYTVKLAEGRNRQIRRSFSVLNYTVKMLHRQQFGEYKLGNLASGQWVTIDEGGR